MLSGLLTEDVFRILRKHNLTELKLARPLYRAAESAWFLRPGGAFTNEMLWFGYSADTARATVHFVATDVDIDVLSKRGFENHVEAISLFKYLFYFLYDPPLEIIAETFAIDIRTVGRLSEEIDRVIPTVYVDLKRRATENL